MSWKFGHFYNSSPLNTTNFTSFLIMLSTVAKRHWLQYFLPTKVIFETTAVCPPGLEAVHMYKPESDFWALSKLILLLPISRRSESDSVIVVESLIQLTLGLGNPVTSQVIPTGVPVSVVTLAPIFTLRTLRVGSNTSTEMFDESMTGNVGSGRGK